MAITFDNAADPAQSTGSTFTFSFTVSGTNPILIVGASARDTGTPGNTVVSSVTFDGNNLTSISSRFDGSNVRTSLWYIVGQTGTANIVVTYAGSVATWCQANAVSLNGVDQSSPVNAFNDANNTGLSINTSVVSVVDNCWGICTLATGAGNTNIFTPDSGNTQRAIESAGDTTLMNTYNGVSPAGSFSMGSSWNVTNAPNVIVAAAIAPATGGGTTWPGYYAPEGWYRKKTVGWRKSLGGIFIPPQVSLA